MKNKTDVVYTTLSQIKANSFCGYRYKKLCKNLGGVRKYGKDTPLSFKQIYASNGYNDTLWCLRCVDEKFYPLWQHLAIDFAEMVEHLMKDDSSINALRVARKYLNGKATEEEMKAAWAAASDAASDAASAAARAAASDASDAARAASDARAAWTAAEVAWAVLYASAAASAASAAASAAWAASDAGDAAKSAQMELLFEYCRVGKQVDWRNHEQS